MRAIEFENVHLVRVCAKALCRAKCALTIYALVSQRNLRRLVSLAFSSRRVVSGVECGCCVGLRRGGGGGGLCGWSSSATAVATTRTRPILPGKTKHSAGLRKIAVAFRGRVHERTPGMRAADFVTWVILRIHGRGRHEEIPGASRFLDKSPPLWLALNERYVHFAAGAQMLPARVQKVREQSAVHGSVFDPEVWVVEHNRGERSYPGARQRDRVDAVHDPGAAM